MVSDTQVDSQGTDRIPVQFLRLRSRGLVYPDPPRISVVEVKEIVYLSFNLQVSQYVLQSLSLL